MKTTRFLFVLVVIVLITGTFVYSQDIYQAVTEGNTEMVAKLLQKDPELLNAKNPDAMTPLNLAAQEGQLEVTALLLDAGADPYIGDNENSGPIHLAAISGSIDIVKLLMKNGVSIDYQDDNGLTPLHFALSRRQFDMANFLIGEGADVKIKSNSNWSALQFAAIGGDLDLVKQIVEKKADINSEIEGGFIPLFSAASYGHLDVVKYLVAKGANIKHEDVRGNTVLFYTRNPNCYGVIEFLISKGADVKHKNNNRQTPLHEVAVRGSVEIADLLLQKGADINAPTLDGRTPLTFATYSRNPDAITKFLILNGADVNPEPCKYDKACTCGPNFYTPLHGAARRGHVGMVKALVDNGAHINVYDNEGLTPFHLAVQAGEPEIVKYLVDHGAFLNSPEKNTGSSELHLAIAMGFHDIAAYLISQGSDPEFKDDNGETAFDYAMKYNHRELAYQLLAAGANDEGLARYLNAPNMINEPVKYGEASVWFLGHSGWAIKTQNNFLIFDYFCNNRDRKPGDSCLASGFVLPEQIKDQKVTVFSTHAHGDHYDEHIFTWKNTIPDIKYVLCWNQNTNGNEYTMVPIHEEKKVRDMNVYVNYSTDLGGGYVVEVDGLVLFHMGDHANGEDRLMTAFTDEIDLIDEKYDHIDILFGGIRGCSLGEPDQVKEGLYYTLELLNPNLFVPMHSGSHSFSYKEFVETAINEGIEQNMKYVIHKGDHFHYSKEMSGTELTGF